MFATSRRLNTLLMYQLVFLIYRMNDYLNMMVNYGQNKVKENVW